jgi:hypothetical protein
MASSTTRKKCPRTSRIRKGYATILDCKNFESIPVPGLKSWRPGYDGRSELDEVLIVVLHVVVLNETCLMMLKGQWQEIFEYNSGYFHKSVFP